MYITMNDEDLVLDHHGLDSPIIIRRHPEIGDEHTVGEHYIFGDYVFEYAGKVDKLKSLKPGQFGLFQGNIYLSHFDENDSTRDIYHVSNATGASNVKRDEDSDIDSVIESYFDNYRKGNNIVLNTKNKYISSSGIFIPDLNASDDALTRIMKKMIIHKRLIPSECRAKFNKDYSFDNMRSALTGTTTAMTIKKFLKWCELLGTEWEFIVEDNGTDEENLLGEPLVISSHQDLYIECGDYEKGIYKVPIESFDDPLKKLIKAAIIKKRINIAKYKDNGPTEYLLNNMRSALKSKSKMMMRYFTNWCEILGLKYTLKVIDPEDGTVYTADPDYQSEEYDVNTI